jgi:uncharacterized membrane protein YfcA
LSEHFIILLLLYLVLGVFTGLISGVLGISGGLVVVPGLAWIFNYTNMAPIFVMHFAVGTSLAVMIVTTLRAMLAHRQYHIQCWPTFRRLAPGVVIGVIIGVFVGHYLHSRALEIILGILVVIIALDMFFMRTINPERQLPGTVGMSGISVFLGGLSGLLGLGGGTFIIPFLTYCNVSLREAMVVSIATGFMVSIVGTVAMIFTGNVAHETLAWSTGFVFWPAWIGVVVGSLLFVPLGVALSYRLPVKILRRFFAVFLFFVGIHLLV